MPSSLFNNRPADLIVVVGKCIAIDRIPFMILVEVRDSRENTTQSSTWVGLENDVIGGIFFVRGEDTDADIVVEIGKSCIDVCVLKITGSHIVETRDVRNSRYPTTMRWVADDEGIIAIRKPGELERPTPKRRRKKAKVSARSSK